MYDWTPFRKYFDGFVLKGATLALHFYLFQFKLINLSEIMPIWTLWLVTFVMIDLVFTSTIEFHTELIFYGQSI